MYNVHLEGITQYIYYSGILMFTVFYMQQLPGGVSGCCPVLGSGTMHNIHHSTTKAALELVMLFFTVSELE